MTTLRLVSISLENLEHLALPVSWAAGGGMFRHAVLRLQLDGDDGLEGSEFGGPSSFGPYQRK